MNHPSKNDLLALQRERKGRWQDQQQRHAMNDAKAASKGKGKGKRRARSKGPDQIVAAWVEPDLLAKNEPEENAGEWEKADAFVVIFRSRGCAWWKKSGCFMCGYFNDTNSAVSDDDYRTQMQHALRRYDGQQIVKIFTSGSFLDSDEMPPDIQSAIVDGFAQGGARKIIVESRPEFVTNDALRQLKVTAPEVHFEIAIGLETASDETLMNSINKGFKQSDFDAAAEILMGNDCSIKTYLLLKPPFMNESNAMDEAIDSTVHAAQIGSKTISINPVNIQAFTVVEKFFRDGSYRPPYLWSLVEVLQRLAALREKGEISADTVLMSSPSGAGSRRGVHNCGECDQMIIDAIKEFSLTQDRAALDAAVAKGCSCRATWEDVLVLEEFVPFNL